CQEFIQALEACHADTWSRWTGGCNDAKLKLNMCLRKERIDRTAINRDVARQRRERTELAWADIREE
ncbi:hypothetical protein BKA93DRAFT_724473, partial [Sparassis latifolia]